MSTNEWLQQFAAALPGVDGFAWPWLLLALPLPWLARGLLPARRSTAPALEVPFGDRLLELLAKR